MKKQSSLIPLILISVFLAGNHAPAQDMPSIYVPEYKEDCKCKPSTVWSSDSPPDSTELHSQIEQLRALVKQQKEGLDFLTDRIKILENRLPPIDSEDLYKRFQGK